MQTAPVPNQCFLRNMLIFCRNNNTSLNLKQTCSLCVGGWRVRMLENEWKTLKLLRWLWKAIYCKAEYDSWVKMNANVLSRTLTKCFIRSYILVFSMVYLKNLVLARPYVLVTITTKQSCGYWNLWLMVKWSTSPSKLKSVNDKVSVAR